MQMRTFVRFAFVESAALPTRLALTSCPKQAHAIAATILPVVRCWTAHRSRFLKLQAQEAMRRAKFKFPGRQKIVESRNWCAHDYSLCQFSVLKYCVHAATSALPWQSGAERPAYRL